jgi:integrase
LAGGDVAAAILAIRRRRRATLPAPSAEGGVRLGESQSGFHLSMPGRLRVRPRLQDLRHTHVAYLIGAGWDFLAIQLRLGHASIRTTFDVYGHLLPRGEQSRLIGLDRQMPFVQAGDYVASELLDETG